MAVYNVTKIFVKVKRTTNHCFRNWNFIFRLVLTIIIIVLGWSQIFNNNNDTKILGNTRFASTTIKTARETQKLSENNNPLETVSIIASLDNDDNEDLYNIRLKRIVKRLNTRQTVRNLHKYGPLTNNSLIIVVQVNTRINYLYEVINSLSKARGIEDVLLIFSHNYYDEKINRLVNGVRFCKTMQIFFPYSTQIYTNVFPGQTSYYDCPRNAARERTEKMNCFNATADQYGHYRDANITQAKHHWWWKINMVFDRLRVVKNYSGLILFMEEDHYVVEDFIHTLKLMQRTLSQSEIFSMGVHSDTLIFFRKPQVHVSNWISNLGISFNRSVWNAFVQCAEEFCYYDDYNWDWSLQKMTKYCNGHTFLTSTLQDSRFYHIGKCGMHYHINCSDMSHVNKLKQTLKSLDLYPEELDVKIIHGLNQMFSAGNGGWGDTRDRKLCMHMVFNHYVNV
ncbi:Hypothetical protein CINCED_3A020739 [Cinara cedri]|uniref:Alpha-1,6-mannosyl-glycoprotein 2-beta-N-acetylglucosaminyltransferase n=1 Tax=Cinara cedri TaxID=506608 RepID=A0A5E4M0X3_9HEMI|nr:Hypothetical protein CINCED_3A020739 [Cinara cedri]